MLVLAQQGLVHWADRAQPSDVQDVFVWALIATASVYVVLQLSKWACVLHPKGCSGGDGDGAGRYGGPDQSHHSQQLSTLSTG